MCPGRSHAVLIYVEHSVFGFFLSARAGFTWTFPSCSAPAPSCLVAWPSLRGKHTPVIVADPVCILALRPQRQHSKRDACSSERTKEVPAFLEVGGHSAGAVVGERVFVQVGHRRHHLQGTFAFHAWPSRIMAFRCKCVLRLTARLSQFRSAAQRVCEDECCSGERGRESRQLDGTA
jgi:hypothetical protein